jgi:hypothetical protein
MSDLLGFSLIFAACMGPLALYVLILIIEESARP